MTAQKYIIFDSGPLINFSMNGLLPLLRKLKQHFKGEFLITKEVKREIIERPLQIKRFQLGALRLHELFKDKIIKHADITPAQVNELRKKRNEIMNITNSTFRTKKKDLHIIDKGESAALALAIVLNKPCVLAIDERTARMLCENPENLRKILEKKLHTKVQANRQNYDLFKNFKVIRSTELVYIAHKKKLIELKDSKAYEAMLYGVKFKGCSISENEVQQMKRL